MTESLELIVESPKTLKAELAESFRNYPRNLKGYLKSLTPMIAIGSVGAGVGQWAAQKLGYDSVAAQTASAYLCGYIPGYAVMFEREFRKNRDKYPRRLSKPFGNFVGTFLASDYVADLSTFTPLFIASNAYLINNSDMPALPRTLLLWNGLGLVYTSVMAGLHPTMQRVNNAINRGIKRTYNKIKGKK